MRIYLLSNYNSLSSIQIIQRFERCLGFKIEGRARRKIKSAYHYLINRDYIQAEHFWKQFEQTMKEVYKIKI